MSKLSIEESLPRQEAKLFLRLLEGASIATLLPMLSARARWRMLIEVLLGHAPIRGGRTRDYPFSVERSHSAQVAQALATTRRVFEPGRNKVSTSFTLYDMVAAVLCIEASHGPGLVQTDWSEEEHYTVALRCLAEDVLPADYHLSVLDALGVSQSGSEGATSRSKQYQRNVMQPAKRMAALAATDIPASWINREAEFFLHHFEMRPRDMQVLWDGELSLVYLKTKGAQGFIDRCQSPYIQRGASYWCSQTTARIREHLCTHGGSFFRTLLLDNDAVTIMVCGKDESEAHLIGEIKHFLLDALETNQLASEYVSANFPRLYVYYKAARMQGDSTATVLPSIGVQVRSKTLFELVVDRASEPSMVPNEPIIQAVVPTRQNPEQAQCSGRVGDSRITDPKLAVPTWYNSGRPDEAYGFPSIAFSLAEVAYAKMGGRSLAETLSDRLGRTIRSVTTQKELLESVGNTDGNLTYLKFDGDGFGAMFSGIPSLCRPQLSVEVELLMRKSWLDANARIVCERQTDVTPSDLVYFGGDDILATVPAVWLNLFLRFFDQALYDNRLNGQQPRFTFAAVTYAARPPGTPTHRIDPRDAMRRIAEVNGLLQQAKKYRAVAGENLVSEGIDVPDGSRWFRLRSTQGLHRDTTR